MGSHLHREQRFRRIPSQREDPFGPGPFNQYRNPYWPMDVGGRWVMRNSATRSPVIITIQQSPPSFGCANLPVPIYIYKIDPTNYWSVNYQAQLHWFLGVKENLDVIGFGHYWVDFADNPGDGSGTSYYRSRDVDPLNNPPYMLLRDLVSGNYSVAQAYPGTGVTGDYACYPDDAGAQVGQWTLNWSEVTVTAPGYSGITNKAAIREESPLVYLENWYFARDFGPVRIEAVQQGGEPVGITLEIVEFQAATGTPMDPHVNFRDLLICHAAATGGFNFYEWNFYYTQATQMAGPDPEEVCLDSSATGNPLTVDAYIALLANMGDTCSSLTWDFTVLTQMEQLAGTTQGLNFDQWNYYYNQVTATFGPNPEDVCMPSVTYVDANPPVMEKTVYPNRWVRYTSRQWFAMFQYQGRACVLSQQPT